MRGEGEGGRRKGEMREIRDVVVRGGGWGLRCGCPGGLEGSFCEKRGMGQGEWGRGRGKGNGEGVRAWGMRRERGRGGVGVCT